MPSLRAAFHSNPALKKSLHNFPRFEQLGDPQPGQTRQSDQRQEEAGESAAQQCRALHLRVLRDECLGAQA